MSLSEPWVEPELRPHVLILDPQQSYKRVEEDALIRAVREGCRHAVRHLPYRLSPVVMGLPGLLLHVVLLVAVHTLERARWMYAAWVLCRVLHFCLDCMDGTQARRNGTQSTARHFWDHWVDVVNSAMAVMIVARLGPQHGVYLPYLLLTVTGQLFFYLGLCRYYATGILRDPYINHLWNYVFCLFLGLSVCVQGLGILEDPGFQYLYTVLSCVTFGAGFHALLTDLLLISQSPLDSVRFHARILTAPVLVLGLYALWLRHSGDPFTSRALVALAMSSFCVDIHARQLVNQPPAWLTPESGLFLLSLPLSVRYPALQPFIHRGLLCLMIGVMLVRLVRFLQEMVAQYPEMGFPLFWLPATHAPGAVPASNKRAA